MEAKDQTNQAGNFENREKSFETATLTADAFADLIYRGESLLKDKRFFRYKDGGVFKFFDSRQIFEDSIHKFYSFVKKDSQIVGISELQKNPHADENKYWIKFISIDEKYQNIGLASVLIHEIMRFAKERGIILESSSYSETGFNKLKSVLNRISRKVGVKFIDTESRI